MAGAATVARVTARRAGLAVVALATLIGLWNTLSYPSGAGFDAASHREYADFVVSHWRLPHENETPEYYSPPFYYALAGLAVKLGRGLGLADPHKLGQLLNVPIVAGIGLLTLGLAGLLWPGRRFVGVASGLVDRVPARRRDVAHREPALRRRRAPEPRQVDRDAGRPTREMRELERPAGQVVRERVQEHERRPVTADALPVQTAPDVHHHPPPDYERTRERRRGAS